MANYSNVDIKKFGDLQQQNAAGHNLRQIGSANVNTKKSHLNVFYVGSANMNFTQTLSAKLSKFKIRKNAVKSVNLVFSASHEFFNDKRKAELWEKQTFEFITKEFGVENIIYAIVHKDEKTPHFQVSVVPVDPKGKLNASHFFDGRKKCDEFATRYNNAVKNLGLKRDKGVNKAKPQDTRDYYEKFQEAKDYDKKVDKAIDDLDKKLSSRFGLIKISTAKQLFQPFYDIIKRYKAKALEDRKKIDEAKKIAQENDDLKLKFDNLGLSHEMKFSECKEVKELISEGRTAVAEREATASKMNKNEVINSPQLIQENLMIKPR